MAAGAHLELRYNLHFGGPAVEPDHGGGRAVSFSATGNALRIDFAGGRLAELPAQAPIEAMVSAADGRAEGVAVERTADGATVRFDVHADSDRPVGLRVYLESQEQTLTETWSFPWLQ